MVGSAVEQASSLTRERLFFGHFRNILYVVPLGMADSPQTCSDSPSQNKGGGRGWGAGGGSEREGEWAGAFAEFWWQAPDPVQGPLLLSYSLCFPGLNSSELQQLYNPSSLPDHYPSCPGHLAEQGPAPDAYLRLFAQTTETAPIG